MNLHQGVPNPPLATWLTLHTSTGAICGKSTFDKHNISLRPDEATLFVMTKACLFLKSILFYVFYKELT